MLKIELSIEDANLLMDFASNKLDDPDNNEIPSDELAMWANLSAEIGIAMFEHTDGTFTSEAEWDKLAEQQERWPTDYDGRDGSLEISKDEEDKLITDQDKLRKAIWEERDPIEIYGTPEHEAWLIEMEMQEG